MIDYVLGILVLLIIGLVNYIISKSFIYPPVIFSLYWSFLLILLFLSGNLFFKISIDTIKILILGPVSLSLGSYCYLVVGKKKYYKLNADDVVLKENYLYLLVNLTLLFAILILPFLLFRIYQIGNISFLNTFWKDVRYQIVYGGEVIGGIKYFSLYIRFIAIISFIESKKIKKLKFKSFLLILISLVYDLVTMSRTGALWLLFSLIGIEIFSSKKILTKKIFVIVFTILIVFIIPAVLLEKGVNSSLTKKDILNDIKETILSYSVSSIVAFDIAKDTPKLFHYLGYKNYNFRFFNSVLYKLGMIDYICPIYITHFVNTPFPTNVYTIYLNLYLDYGSIAIFISFFMIGIFASFIYNAAKYNNESIYRLLYGMLFAAFILSNANDTFFVHLSLWVQIIIYSVFLKKLLYFNRVDILRYAKK